MEKKTKKKNPSKRGRKRGGRGEGREKKVEEISSSSSCRGRGRRRMAPVKKSKKGKRKSKDSGKLKIVKYGGGAPPLPPELRGLDTEWWYTFLHKHSELGIACSFPRFGAVDDSLG